MGPRARRHRAAAGRAAAAAGRADPAGRPFTQALAPELAGEPWLVFACGRYEGIDARVPEYAAARMRVDEVSIGDYVLAGGEVAVLVIVEAVARLLPGVLGNAESVVDDSFAAGARAARGAGLHQARRWRGLEVPAGAAVRRPRRDRRVARASSRRQRTAARRPDLL